MRKPNVGFRCPLDLYEYLRSLKAKGTEPTEVITKALRLSKDLAERMGDDWWEIERRANVAEMSLGAQLAELALAGLTSKHPSGQKK